jgi:predicted metal-dependent phosphoesterase TrpH
MVDLHLHTNASDGRCTPAELVSCASGAGLSTISITDHDTIAAIEEAQPAAVAAGVRLVPGIEVTAVWQELDVHVLGYYLDPADRTLDQFLRGQRADRVRRVHVILDRLRALGVPVEFDAVVAPVGGRVPQSVGRPQVARAMVLAGHVTDTREAFDRYLAEGRPAYVARLAAAPADTVRLILQAGGIAALAHPALLSRDDLIPGLVDAGMQAIEVFHPNHPADVVAHYRELAHRFRLLATGGSDYHADGAHGGEQPGSTTLPAADFERLDALASRLHSP